MREFHIHVKLRNNLQLKVVSHFYFQPKLSLHFFNNAIFGEWLDNATV